jgi:hypothetical protein
MSITQDANSFLMGSSARGFKFTEPGDKVSGRIVSLDMQQQRDFSTGKPKFWNDDENQPMMQLRIILQTELADDKDDDGQRAVYVKGEMQKAVKAALAESGAKQIEEGATLRVKFTGLGAKEGNLNAPKLYQAQYEPPAQGVSVDDF